MTDLRTRQCQRCGGRLAHDRTTGLCASCLRIRRENPEHAPKMRLDFWETDQIREALTSKDMGAVVRAYRCHPEHGRKPITQMEMARWLGITQGQLSRIECGRNLIRDLDKLVHYARCLHIPADLLWFDTGEDGTESPLPRPAGAITLPGGTSIPAAETATEPALAETLLATLQQYATTDNLAGPHTLLNIPAQQMPFIENLLKNGHSRHRGQLIYVAARFAEFTGWLHQDAGDPRTAMQWSNTALDFAREADDAHLVSYVRMRKSNIASDAHKPQLAISLAREALQHPGALTPRLNAVALRQEAHGHALSRNPDGCARALDRAFQLAADVDDDNVDIAHYCTPSYIEMEAAHCWIELGKPERAITTLQQGLAYWHEGFRRDLGLCLARLAVAHAGTRQPDDALTVAEQALTIAADTRSHRTARQLHRTSDLLEQAGAREHARHLRHNLRTTLG